MFRFDARWWRFLIVGGVCFCANLLVLYVGTGLLGLHYLVSMLISIVVANSLGWLLNRVWSFRSRDIARAAEYLRYLSVTFVSSAVSFVLMALLVGVFGVHYLLASGLIAAGMTILNFLAHRGWSFSGGRVGAKD